MSKLNLHKNQVIMNKRKLADLSTCTILQNDSKDSDNIEYKPVPIGSGTYGKIYLSRCGIMAKKIMHTSLISDYGDLLANQLREVCFLKSFRHPNIIYASNVSLINKKLHIEMEAGQCDLRKYIYGFCRKRMIDPHILAKLIFQVSSGLEFLHSNGIIHRDIKPENIMVMKNGDFKIIDLGLCSLDLQAPKIGDDYYFTIWFRPPEVLLQNSYTGYTSDIWSLGCVIWICLCRKPFIEELSEFEALRAIFGLFPRTRHTDTYGLDISRLNPTLLDLLQDVPLSTEPILEKLKRNIVDYFDRDLELPKSLMVLLLQMLHPNPKERLTPQEIIESDFIKEYYTNENINIQLKNNMLSFVAKPLRNYTLSSDFTSSLRRRILYRWLLEIASSYIVGSNSPNYILSTFLLLDSFTSKVFIPLGAQGRLGKFQEVGIICFYIINTLCGRIQYLSIDQVLSILGKESKKTEEQIQIIKDGFEKLYLQIIIHEDFKFTLETPYSIIRKYCWSLVPIWEKLMHKFIQHFYIVLIEPEWEYASYFMKVLIALATCTPEMITTFEEIVPNTVFLEYANKYNKDLISYRNNYRHIVLKYTNMTVYSKLFSNYSKF